MKKLIYTLISMVLTTNALAAEISHQKRYNVWQIKIEGEIVRGDHNKFQDIISDVFTESLKEFKDNFEKFQREAPSLYQDLMTKHRNPEGATRVQVVLNSDGGNLLEAMQIGRDIRTLLIDTKTGQSSEDIGQWNKCLSACFFIWSAGISRSAIMPAAPGRPPYLGIHRLYFAANEYSQLTSKEANDLYRQLDILAESYLNELGIPDKFYEKMLTTSSNEIYYLSSDEINQLSTVAPYFDELLHARCKQHIEDDEYDRCVSFEKGIEQYQSFVSYRAEKEL